jgi:cell division protein FtsL
MAKSVGRRAEGGGGKGKAGGRRGPKIVLLLVGFVLVAIGVQMRRVYGVQQGKLIRQMEQRREALLSEELKAQDAIRVASDRSHIMEIARTRLNMRMPELNQVIDLPRRPMPRGRDSLRP